MRKRRIKRFSLVKQLPFIRRDFRYAKAKNKGVLFAIRYTWGNIMWPWS